MKPTPATTAELAYLTAQVEAFRYRLPHPIEPSAYEVEQAADKLIEMGAL
jgi:hypothetical protein